MSTVLYQKITDHIALVTLNRPDAYNAINAEVTQEMDAIVQQTENDPSVRVVILNGAGDKAFCAGADLKVIAAGKGDSLYSDNGGFGGLVYAKRTKPWIAAVHGFALAGGLEMSLACDIIIAAEGTKFGLPEVKRGLVAGAGGLYRLPQVLPAKLATSMILTGEFIDAKRAYDLGMVLQITKVHNLVEIATQLALSISKNSPNAMKESMNYMQQLSGKSEETMQEELTELFKHIITTPDALEGSSAFTEKREPKWN